MAETMRPVCCSNTIQRLMYIQKKLILFRLTGVLHMEALYLLIIRFMAIPIMAEPKTEVLFLHTILLPPFTQKKSTWMATRVHTLREALPGSIKFYMVKRKTGELLVQVPFINMISAHTQVP